MFSTTSNRSKNAKAKTTRQPGEGGGGAPKPERNDRDPFRVYGVNVILAHGESEKCPVIFETIPDLREPVRHDSSQL